MLNYGLKKVKLYYEKEILKMDNSILINKILFNYVYRKDLHTLFSKHDLNNYILKNGTSIKFIEEIFSNNNYENMLDSLSNFYNLDKNVIDEDFTMFIKKILFSLNENKKNLRQREGIPSWIELDEIQFPLSIEIEITKRCNWNCKFCYNVWKYSSNKSDIYDLNFKSYKKIIDEAVDNGCLTVRLSGGEPTLHPQFKEFVKYASDKGLNIALFTNGSNISDEMIDFYKLNNIRTILISLHGLEKQHEQLTSVQGSYKTTLEVLKKLVDNGISTSVETILSGMISEEDLFELGNTISKIGIKNWNLMPYVCTGSIDDEIYRYNLNKLSILMNRLENINLNIRVVCSQKLCIGNYNVSVNELENNTYIDGNCGSGILWISISYDGKIRNCPHSNVYAGSIEEGIKKLYLKKLKPNIIKILKNNIDCIECKAFNECRGGCHLEKIKEY